MLVLVYKNSVFGMEMLVVLAIFRLFCTVNFRHRKCQLIAPVAVLLLVYFIAISPPMVTLATRCLSRWA